PRGRLCLVSLSAEWVSPTSWAGFRGGALNPAAANVSFVEIETDKGHDSFLLDEPDLDRTVRGFLCGVADHAGLA
ncbi:MAG: homoserine O-acetyltransferase, partial [Acetobacter persici]